MIGIEKTKNMLKKTIVIIPAFNEDRFILTLLKKLNKFKFNNIVVIDDGSNDDTAFFAKQGGVTILKHELNRGMGAATQTGIDWGIKNGYEYFLTIDADGQQKIEDLKRILKTLEDYKCVIGSRFLEKNKIPLFRYLANKVANILTGIIFGIWVTDSQSGLRGFHRDVAKKLHLHSDGFEFCSDFIREVYFLGFEIKEIPISVLYTKETMAKGQNLAEGLKTLSKLCLRAITR